MGAGWTSTQYDKDVDFLASSQARNNPEAYLQVKRAQWIGDVMGEERVYGENSKLSLSFGMPSPYKDSGKLSKN